MELDRHKCSCEVCHEALRLVDQASAPRENTKDEGKRGFSMKLWIKEVRTFLTRIGVANWQTEQHG